MEARTSISDTGLPLSPGRSRPRTVRGAGIARDGAVTSPARPRPSSAQQFANSAQNVLVLNSGSSSLKFALFQTGDPEPALVVRGKVDRIGMPGTTLAIHQPSILGDGQQVPSASELQPSAGAQALPTGTHDDASQALFEWLARSPQGDLLGTVIAVGHRVVHGMAHAAPELVTDALLAELRRTVPLDPAHLPMEISLIEQAIQVLPRCLHVACFDTAFHRGMPRVAQQLPIPRRYEALGLKRYGFHGLSYAYLCEELARLESKPAARSRVVLAHLGSGASMAAVRDGHSIDTSMSFSPCSGLPMSTRSGDLDPGIAAYLARTEELGPAGFFAMANHESGLLGISETNADMRDLLRLAATDVRAAEAVGFFCYQARKCIGAYAAALGGLDTLVFAGGIGEQAAAVRALICDGLGFLGIDLDAGRNAAHAGVISTDAARTTVRVIATDEERLIARSVHLILRRQDPELRSTIP
jgi:acetate kinase